MQFMQFKMAVDIHHISMVLFLRSSCMKFRQNPFFFQILNFVLYFSQCANGTMMKKFIEDFWRPVNQTKLPFGVPNEVSKERCDSLIPPLPSTATPTLQPNTPQTVPTVTAKTTLVKIT